MAGGPTVNLVIAFVLFAGIFGLHGTYEPTTTVVGRLRVRGPRARRRAATAPPPTRSTPGRRGRAAARRRIVSFNGTEIDDWDELVTLIRANEDGEAVIGYVRDGELRDGDDQHDGEVGAVARRRHGVRRGRLPRRREHRRAARRHGLLFTVEQMGVDDLGHRPGARPACRSRSGASPRRSSASRSAPQDSPVSVVGAGRVAGEVTSDVDEPGRRSGSSSCVSLLAGLNLFVGMFNFIPLLPLDGGHIAGALYEGAAARRGTGPRPARPGVRRRRQAAAGRLRDGRRAAGDEHGAHRRRHRRPDQPRADPSAAGPAGPASRPRRATRRTR